MGVKGEEAQAEGIVQSFLELPVLHIHAVVVEYFRSVP